MRQTASEIQSPAWRSFAKDALLYNGTLGALIVGSLAYNPEIWVGDYPPDIQEKFGPQSQRARRQGLWLAAPFFAIMVGGVILSNWRLKRRNGGRLPVSAAFANAFGLIFSGWFLDLTILDWLMFVTYTPGFVVLPGTEGLAGYDDYGFHLREHIRALPFLAVGAFAAALLTASFPWRWR